MPFQPRRIERSRAHDLADRLVVPIHATGFRGLLRDVGEGEWITRCVRIGRRIPREYRLLTGLSHRRRPLLLSCCHACTR
jgi:hypothetical protein